jgi:hypothetical protein
VGCHKDEPYVVDKKTKTIWLCRGFVERMYTKFVTYDEHVLENTMDELHWSLTMPTDKFDKCGFEF